MQFLGYELGPGGVDGYWGLDTENAVIQFQQDQELTADGVVGSNTYNALNQELQKFGGRLTGGVTDFEENWEDPVTQVDVVALGLVEEETEEVI